MLPQQNSYHVHKLSVHKLFGIKKDNSILYKDCI